MGIANLMRRKPNKIVLLVSSIWFLFLLIAASLLMAGMHGVYNLSFQDCFYGGVSSELTNGQIESGVNSRSCGNFVSLVSCSEMYTNVWNNQSWPSGLGAFTFAGVNWQGNVQLRDFAMQKCEAVKRQAGWVSGWTGAFMIITGLITVYLASHAVHKAGMMVGPLGVVCIVLILSTYANRPDLDSNLYDCKGLPDSVYGDTTCNNAAAAQAEQPVAQRRLATPAHETVNFGGTLPRCIEAQGLKGFALTQALYNGVGGNCLTDQAGNNGDTIAIAFNSKYSMAMAGIVMGLLATLPLMAYFLYSAHNILIVNFGDDDADEYHGASAAYDAPLTGDDSPGAGAGAYQDVE